MRCAAPETQRKPAYQADAKPGVSRKRKGDLTPAQKAKMLVAYAALPTDKGGWKVGVGALCKEYRCWRALSEAGPAP